MANTSLSASAPFMVRKVGIALAAFRPEPAVFAEQLASIRSQEYKNWVCVITCDSPIGELKEDTGLKAFFEDSRFVWEENPVRLGHKKNFERAIQRAAQLEKVNAIACSDQDDRWYPNKLSVSVQALQVAGPLALVHCDMHPLRQGKIESRTAWTIERRGVRNCAPAHLLIRNVVAGCASLFDAELARRFPNIPEEVEFHDHWYALVASCHGGVHPIPEPLFAYRQHEGNVVGVSPFRGVFWLPSHIQNLWQVIEKCQQGWRKSHALAASALREGLPLSKWNRVAFVERGLDCGVLIFTMGLFHLKRDPALARASLARGGGKAFDFLGAIWRPASSQSEKPKT